MKKKEVYWLIAIAVVGWIIYGSYKGGVAAATYAATT